MADLDELIKFIAISCGTQVNPQYELKDAKIFEEHFTLKLRDEEWTQENTNSTVIFEKAVELRNDTDGLTAEGELNSHSENDVLADLVFEKGIITKKDKYGRGLDFSAGLLLPDEYRVKFPKANPYITVDMTKDKIKVRDPISVKSKMKVELQSGARAEGVVSSEKFVYQGRFKAKAELDFKMKIFDRNHPAPIDVTLSDFEETKLPVPFKIIRIRDETRNTWSKKIVWNVSGKMDLRLDHTKVVQLK